jgi:hypothetical protein
MSALFLFGAGIGYKEIIGKFSARREDFKEGNINQEISYRKIILYIKSVGWYVKNIIIPDKPSMYNNFMDEFGYTKEAEKKAYSFNDEFYFGLLVFLSLGYLAAVTDNLWAFLFLLFITPWCNLYQVTMNAADRYQTIAGCGVMVLLAQGLLLLPGDIRLIVVSGLACFYLTRYTPLFDAYKSVERYHQYHLMIDRYLVSPRMFLCKIWLARKDPLSAYAMAKDGLRYRPTNFKMLLCLWDALWAMGNIKKSLQVLAVAEKYIPIGEEEDTKRFFGQIREQADQRMRHHHNNGQPIIKSRCN